MHQPPFAYTTGLIAMKLSTISLLVVVPSVLYLYTWKPVGLIFFAWIGLYLLLRIYSGVHEREKLTMDAWKQLQAIEDKNKHTYVKRNLTVFGITLVLTVIALWVGYIVGGKLGFWIGVAISSVVWLISPYETKVIEKSRDKN
jgi:hypothetical protein